MILALLIAALPHDHLAPSAIINFPPLLGVAVDERGPAFALALQWSGALESERGSLLRPSHLALEAGVLLGSEVRFAAHAGLRWMHPLTPWLLAGPGVGMGVDIGRQARPVTQLELAFRLGSGPLGYGLVVLRAEVRLDGSTNWTVLVGGTSR